MSGWGKRVVMWSVLKAGDKRDGNGVTSADWEVMG